MTPNTKKTKEYIEHADAQMKRSTNLQQKHFALFGDKICHRLLFMPPVSRNCCRCRSYETLRFFGLS
jgi:hypothetical protein